MVDRQTRARRIDTIDKLQVAPFGARPGILTLVDDFTRECLGLVVDTSLTAPRVVRELCQIIESRGCPRMIVSDNGTEFTSNANLAWREELGIEWHYIAPGRPQVTTTQRKIAIQS